MIEGVMSNGANYSDLILLTGHDTYMNLQQLLTKGGDGGAATILRYDAAQEGAASQNGVLGQAGLTTTAELDLTMVYQYLYHNMLQKKEAVHPEYTCWTCHNSH